MLYSYINYNHKKIFYIPTANNIEMLRNGHTKIHMEIHRHVQRTQKKSAVSAERPTEFPGDLESSTRTFSSIGGLLENHRKMVV